MSSNWHRPSRQRLPDQPLGPHPPYDGAPFSDDSQLGTAHGGFEPNTAEAGQQPHPPEGPLYGLAADLAGVAPPAVVGPAGGSLAARPPARLGAARSNRPAIPSAMPYRPPSRGPTRPTSAHAGSAPVADPFAAANLQRQQLPPAPDGEVHYGLALELLNNQDSGFMPSPAATDRRSERERRRGAGAARLGAPDRAAVVPSTQPPPLDPFTVMELAASQEGLPEPDYGIVAELRNRVAPDPFADDFGLVAEVARRRSRSRSPLGRGVGALPPLRARRRMDPVADNAFGLADAGDATDPFGAATRPGDLDPFAAADEQLKIPKELIEPYERSQQELPGDSVLLKADDASETSAVSRDDQQYGIADELGVDPATGRRQGLDEFGNPLPGQPGADGAEPPEPPGHKYTYDEDTGMLTSTAGNQGESGRNARQYIEDEVTGTFYRLQSKRRKLLELLRRKPQVTTEEEEDEEDDKGFRGRLRRTLVFLVNFFNILGMFAQGLVAGFAILNFFMTYMLYSSGSLYGFLSYYSPISQNNNRIYYSLLVFAVIASTARLARDRLREFRPRKLLLAAVDYGQLLLYIAAYVASVLCTPLDDELTYEYDRNPRYYNLTFSSAFKKRIAIWHILNLVRTICVGLAWLLTCYQMSPYVFDMTLRADLRTLREQYMGANFIPRSGAVGTDPRASLKAA